MKKPENRIQSVMDYLGMNKNSFSKEIGMSSNVTIGRIINENRKPHSTTLKKIVSRFPQINYEWLLTGEGEMLITSKSGLDENIIFANETSNTLNEDNMKILTEMMTVISKQSDQIDRLINQQENLISQVERSGDRADRMLTIIEHVNGVDVAQKKEAI